VALARAAGARAAVPALATVVAVSLVRRWIGHGRG
jgi:hypothetical protein